MKGKHANARMKALDDVVEMCDEASTNPFRKKKPEMAEEMAEGEKPEAVMLAMKSDDGDDEESEMKSKLADIDLEDLVQLYERLKSGKMSDDEEEDA